MCRWEYERGCNPAMGSAARRLVDQTEAETGICRAKERRRRRFGQAKLTDDGVSGARPDEKPRRELVWSSRVILPRLLPRILDVDVDNEQEREMNAGRDLQTEIDGRHRAIKAMKLKLCCSCSYPAHSARVFRVGFDERAQKATCDG